MYNNDDNEKYNSGEGEVESNSEEIGYDSSYDGMYSENDDFDYEEYSSDAESEDTEFGDDDGTDSEGVYDENDGAESDDEYYEDDEYDVETDEDGSEQVNSPYLNRTPNPDNQGKRRRSLVPVLLILILILAGLLGATYFKTKSFDVTQLFVAQNQNNNASTANDVKTIEDNAIAKQGDDLFAEAVKAGVEDNAEKKAENKPESASAPTKQPAPETLANAPQNPQIEPVATDLTKTLPDGNTKVIPVRQTMTGRREPFYPIGYRAPVVQSAKDQNVAEIARLENELNLLIADRERRNRNIARYSRDYSEPAIDSAFPDEEAVKEVEQMLSITVSGIMYDVQKPSAIVQLDNVDYFVHKGDKFNDFLVKDIGKKFVVIQKGSNTYTAYLGQSKNIVSGDTTAEKRQFKEVKDYVGSDNYIPVQMRKKEGVNFNQVTNIDKKFGGAYARPSKSSIIINGK